MTERLRMDKEAENPFLLSTGFAKDVVDAFDENMKRVEPQQPGNANSAVPGSYSSHNYVTVIPVDYPPSESSSLSGVTGNSGVRRDDPRSHLPGRNEYASSCQSDSPSSLSAQSWYNNRPGTRYSVSSLHSASNEWNGVRNERLNSQTLPVKKQEVCVMLMNKVGLSLEVDNLVQATTMDLLEMIFHDEQEIALPTEAKNIFSLWMVSPLLEVQLKPRHRPYQIRQQWEDLLRKYAVPRPDLCFEEDDPVLVFRRNVFYDKKEETRITDIKILELLYEEAKGNILEGRYLCDFPDCEMLAGIQAKLELDNYDRDVHTPEFFKSRIGEFLPEYACKTSWSLLGFGQKIGAEHRVLNQFRSIPSNTIPYKLLRKYLEFCWALPFYGSAFFPGQIERPAKGLLALVNHYDLPVSVAINKEGVHLFDSSDSSLLLSLEYKDLSWDFANPQQKGEDCLPCLFLQFKLPQFNRRETNLLQVFSRQARLMDALISSFVDEINQRPSWPSDEVDGLTSPFHDDHAFGTLLTPKKARSDSAIASQLKKLSLATFNEAGECVCRSGSWSFKK